jgi:hypothetical protein
MGGGRTGGRAGERRRASWRAGHGARRLLRGAGGDEDQDEAGGKAFEHHVVGLKSNCLSTVSGGE